MFNIKRDIYEIEAEMRRRYNRLKSAYVYPSFGPSHAPSARAQFSEVIPHHLTPKKIITIGDIRPDEAMGDLYSNYGQSLELANTKKPKNPSTFTRPNYNHPAYTITEPSSDERERIAVAKEAEKTYKEAYNRDKQIIMDRAKVLNQEKWDRQQERLAKEEEKRLRVKDRADAKMGQKLEGDRVMRDKENSQINIM
jgi:hypothetical protein